MRYARLVLLGLLALAAGLALPRDAQAYTWSTVTVDAGGLTVATSTTMDDSGHPMIAYAMSGAEPPGKFATCDPTASATGHCDQTADWSTAAIHADGYSGVGDIAVDGDSNPMIAYARGRGFLNVRFAICIRSASANGNCDEEGDWNSVIVDPTGIPSDAALAVDDGGNPMLSFMDKGNNDLQFANCARSASAHGNCDEPGDWTLTTIDTSAVGGRHSITVDANGDVMIVYKGDTYVRFAICDRSASVNGSCTWTGDWVLADVDIAGMWGMSIALDSDGDPLISYVRAGSRYLHYAICDRSVSTNGNCDQQGDWRAATVASLGDGGHTPSIAVDRNGDPMISHNSSGDGPNYFGFAMCNRSASTNGNCDQHGDWTSELVADAHALLIGEVAGYAMIAHRGAAGVEVAMAPVSDADGDGAPDATDNCPDTANPNQENDVHPGTFAGDHCEDPDADGLFDIDDPCPDNPDCDGDSQGIGDAFGLYLRDGVEVFLGTLVTVACAATSTIDDEDPDALGPDWNDSQDVDGSDLFLFAERFGSELGVPPPVGKKAYLQRFDIYPTDVSLNKVDGSDLFVLATYFGDSCP